MMLGFGKGQGGGGKGQGGAGRARQGLGQGQGRGRQGGSAAGPDGVCVCPRCGHAQPHQRGVPCAQAECPQCGAALRRG